ncbi:MAG: RNA polymerase sigma factor [Bacteroidia bacterium]
MYDKYSPKHDDVYIRDLIGSDITLKQKVMALLYLKSLDPLDKLVLRSKQNTKTGFDLASGGLVVLIDNLEQGRFKKESSLFTYYLGICRGDLMNHLRKVGKSTDLGDLAEIHPAFSADSQYELDASVKLWYCIELLPAFCQTVLKLRFFGENGDGFEMNNEQIKERVGLEHAFSVSNKFNNQNCWELLRRCYLGNN